MMDVYWLEQTEAGLPADNDWLSAGEVSRLSGMRFAKRQADWRLGRWTAKRALALYLHLPDDPQGLTKIEIRPAPSGAPEVFVAEQACAAVISLSHRAGVAACAVASPGAEIGCDLEVIEPRSDAFVADYFTAEEQALIEADLGVRSSPAAGPALEREGECSESAAHRSSTRHSGVAVCPVLQLQSRGENVRAQNPAFTLESRTVSMPGNRYRWFMKVAKSSMGGGKIPATSCGPLSPLLLQPRRFFRDSALILPGRFVNIGEIH